VYQEIAIPNNNEEEFIQIASKLGIKRLCFLYDFDKFSRHDLEIEVGFVVNHNNMHKAIQKSKFLVVKSSDKDRFFIESNKIKLIYGFEELQKKDYLHQRASGLNHILCELTKKNKVAIGFCYSMLLSKKPSASSILIGRMMQNIALCQKYKVKTIIGSFSDKPFDLRAPHDVISLFAMLGMDGKKIKESLTLHL